MALFKNKYRVETTRLKNWDYGNEAAYFITICTKHREHFFGEIRNEEMTLNDIGNIVRNEWQQTPRIRPDMNLTLDEFTVMPNHFHAIIFIGQNQFNGQPDIIGEDSLQNNNKKKFSPQSKNLSSIIRGFKSSVTTQAQKINRNFAWQERFHDHIIRNHESYVFIRNYILNNPVNWTEDTFYTI